MAISLSQVELPSESELDKLIYLESGCNPDDQNQITNNLLHIHDHIQDQQPIINNDKESDCSTDSSQSDDNNCSKKPLIYVKINLKTKNGNVDLCDKQQKNLMCWLALCYLWGRGTISKNKQKGYQMLLDQSKEENPSSLSFTGLGECYRWGYGNQERDYQKSVEYFQQGASLGDRRAMWELGNRYYWGEGVYKNKQEAHRLWKLSQQCQYIHAHFYMGTNYLKGKRGIEQEVEKGVKLIKEACDKNYGKAINYYARYERELQYEREYEEQIMKQKQKVQSQRK